MNRGFYCGDRPALTDMQLTRPRIKPYTSVETQRDSKLSSKGFIARSQCPVIKSAEIRRMKDKVKANFLQRKRVKRLNEGFNDLKRVLRIDSDASKIWTLNQACQYIDLLTKLLRETSKEDDCESSEVGKVLK